MSNHKDRQRYLWAQATREELKIIYSTMFKELQDLDLTELRRWIRSKVIARAKQVNMNEQVRAQQIMTAIEAGDTKALYAYLKNGLEALQVFENDKEDIRKS